jgi:hypothetical protein
MDSLQTDRGKLRINDAARYETAGGCVKCKVRHRNNESARRTNAERRTGFEFGSFRGRSVRIDKFCILFALLTCNHAGLDQLAVNRKTHLFVRNQRWMTRVSLRLPQPQGSSSWLPLMLNTANVDVLQSEDWYRNTQAHAWIGKHQLRKLHH